MDGERDCIFCRIAAKEVPADIVFEDDNYLVLHDINQQAPVHLLVIPRQHIADLMAADFATYTGIMETVQRTARDFSLDKKGFRLVTNCGEEGGQVVPHLHFHILGGRKMGPSLG